ncbi:type II toxin-antitoxin system RelE/ParE family toxin [Nocardia sp. NPDC058666]|uniref:type II toxin-antitoxin system RelE/ParE family toxin n=1 Tax=Nocardia sp. NPDC058666 TaxID=3346587 RepID=UPI0036657906
MSVKPVQPSVRASADVRDAVDFYLDAGVPAAANGFVDALQATYRLIGLHPGIGSSFYAHELDVPGLRSRALAKYPYLVFYLERTDRIDVWRVLHQSRDLPTLLQRPEKP